MLFELKFVKLHFTSRKGKKALCLSYKCSSNEHQSEIKIHYLNLEGFVHILFSSRRRLHIPCSHMLESQ